MLVFILAIDLREIVGVRWQQTSGPRDFQCYNTHDRHREAHCGFPGLKTS